MGKHRSDSTLGRLAPEIREEIDELLLAGTSYKEVKEQLGEMGIKISIPAISNYYRLHLYPEIHERQTSAALKLNKMDNSEIDQAMHVSIKQKVFEFCASPSGSSLDIQRLYGLVLRGEKLAQEERKLKMLEEKAYQADAAKAALENKDLTPEEKSDRLKAVFGICA